MMLVNSLPRFATVAGDLASKLQVTVAPLLSYLTPVLVCLSMPLVTALYDAAVNRTISEAVARTWLATAECANSSAFLE